mmetsp:Transcript_49803/g.132106  ORF Transcript_49803/g.132106 Transcript_49803/m.132106 type:complete len:279 (+) Transcript_49803:797-1633(+)
MQVRWMANCPSMLKRIAGWNTEERGRTLCMRSTGRAKVKAKDATVIAIPLAIICASDGLVPSTLMADMVYAEIIDSSIMISICWTADNNVHLPCLTMSMQAPMDGVRVVKGAAVDASPNCTIGVSSIASNSLVILAAPAAMELPCFFWTACCSLASSVFILLITFAMAPNCALKPTSSPLALLACNSSSTHCCCLDIRSLLLRANSSDAFFEATCARAAVSFLCSANAVSASSTSFKSSATSPALAFPKPLRRAMPTSASFKAPTSLPPSPHIRVATF